MPEALMVTATLLTDEMQDPVRCTLSPYTGRWEARRFDRCRAQPERNMWLSAL